MSDVQGALVSAEESAIRAEWRPDQTIGRTGRPVRPARAEGWRSQQPGLCCSHKRSSRASLELSTLLMRGSWQDLESSSRDLDTRLVDLFTLSPHCDNAQQAIPRAPETRPPPGRHPTPLLLHRSCCECQERDKRARNGLPMALAARRRRRAAGGAAREPAAAHPRLVARACRFNVFASVVSTIGRTCTSLSDCQLHRCCRGWRLPPVQACVARCWRCAMRAPAAMESAAG